MHAVLIFDVVGGGLFFIFLFLFFAVALWSVPISGLILGLRPANERQRYFVATYFIGLAKTWKSAMHLLNTRVASLVLGHDYHSVNQWSN